MTSPRRYSNLAEVAWTQVCQRQAILSVDLYYFNSKYGYLFTHSTSPHCMPAFPGPGSEGWLAEANKILSLLKLKFHKRTGNRLVAIEQNVDKNKVAKTVGKL
jgi:hypothetical protein